jgi:predicted flap endonuclease-1-like 5' DNA nuclease
MIGRLMAVGAAVAAAAVGAATWAKKRGAHEDPTEEVAPGALSPDEQAAPPAAEPLEPAPVVGGDELTTIKGIGAVISGRLVEAGVTSYQQISGWDDAAVEAMAAEIKVSPERIRREEWVDQARALSQG